MADEGGEVGEGDIDAVARGPTELGIGKEELGIELPEPVELGIMKLAQVISVHRLGGRCSLLLRLEAGEEGVDGLEEGLGVDVAGGGLDACL